MSKANPVKARLVNIFVEEVSLVPRGANRFPLLLIKRRLFGDQDNQGQQEQDNKDLQQSTEIPILAATEEGEQHLVTGVVLVPDVEDHQGDTVTVQAVQKAAHDFLTRRQKAQATAKLGVMHKFFDRSLELVESYVAPVDMNISGKKVKKGSWVVTFKVLDADTWQAIKQGKIRGFSLQGKGRGERL